MTDDLIRFAQRSRLEAAAALVQTIRNEGASDNARIAAAEKILHYSDGRATQARRVTVADIANMTDSERQELLDALLQHYVLGGFQALLRQACSDAVAEYQRTLISHRPSSSAPCHRHLLPP
jgi:hypothetical protein